MGEVWRGIHTEQGVPVAIKVITGKGSRDPQFMRDFRNEVRAVAGLNHPGIVFIFDYGVIDQSVEEATSGRLVAGSPYLVMEYAGQGTLASIRGALSWREFRALLIGLLDSLAHGHARGIVHRDLKPANVLLCGPDEARPGIKLTDFGIAHIEGGELTERQKDRMMGTRHYMAPEQVLCWWRDFGPWTDLYAVGCLVYTLLTGQPPFFHLHGKDVIRAQVQKAPPPLESRILLPDGFSDWVACLLEKWPHLRFQCAADASRALVALGEPDGSEDDDVDPLFRGWNLTGREAVVELGHLKEEEMADMFDDSLATLVPEVERIELELDTNEWRQQRGNVIRTVPSPVIDTWRRAVESPPSLQLLGAGLGLFELRTWPLVGRESERERLWEMLKEVQLTAQPRVMVVNSRPGEGKTRLVQWLSQRAQELGAAQTLKVTCRDGDSSDEAVQRMLKQRLRIGGLTGEELRERLESQLEPRGMSDSEIGALVRVVSKHNEEDARQQGWARREVIVDWIECLANERPVLLWIEDAHWGPDALELAVTLLEDGESCGPVCVVVTVREDALRDETEEGVSFQRLLAFEEVDLVDLQPLPTAERAKLVRELLCLDGTLAAQVEERTGGNPLFAVQLVGDWIQRGLLIVGAHGFVLKDGVRADIPDHVHGVWATRIEEMLIDLPEAARWYLERAAILGQEVDEEEWHSSCDDAGMELGEEAAARGRIYDQRGLWLRRELMDRLVARRMVYETEQGWAFAQTLLRESLERMAREGNRWVAHHFACSLVVQDQVEETRSWERLGRHLIEAGAHREAVDALYQGVRVREASGALRSALSLLALYEEALSVAYPDRNEPAWGRLWSHRAGLMWQLGLRRESIFWSDKAIAIARENQWSRQLRERLALRVSWSIEDRDEPVARRALHELWTSLEGETDPMEWGQYFKVAGSHERVHRNFDEAMFLFGRARSCFGEAKEERLRTWCLIPMALVDLEEGDLDEMEIKVERIERVFAPMGDRYGLAHVAYLKSRLARVDGVLDSAMALALEARSLWQECGAREVILATANIGLIRLKQARYGDARNALEETRKSAERGGWKHPKWVSVIGLLPCTAAHQDWGVWDELLPHVKQVLRGGRFLEADTVWPLELAGQIALEVGETSRAKRAYELAVSRFRYLGNEQRVSEIEAAVAAISG